MPLEEFKEQLEKVVANQDKILLLLKGNELDQGDRGLVGKVAEQGKSIKNLERFKDRTLWLAIGAGLTGGYELTAIIKHFISI